ncbi:alpha/beta fold hydrolase [Alkalibacillus aidingensis]|uniref:alpha/beta fold hydrolase n=1 Tax=Alkalibacillus aidingensis TaxID=2747607 RepID=UPI0016618169|nr:alpha/beta hydrolase [Alkalibacillus aidingensis]
MKRRVERFTFEGKTLEYSVIDGPGPEILVMHGGHSNCYEEFGYQALVDAGYTIITPSRAGYGGTAKEIGVSLSEACRYYVELLNNLGLDKVHLIAISAGGPSGIYLASHYPDRFKSLSLQAAVSKHWLSSSDLLYRVSQVLFRPSTGDATWKTVNYLSERFPDKIFKRALPILSTLSYEQVMEEVSDDGLDQLRDVIKHFNAGHGFMIDIELAETLKVSDLEKVSCPTLILHSIYDNAVSFAHAEHSQQHIENSKLVTLDCWGHGIWIGKKGVEVDQEQVAFLKEFE